MNSFERRVLNLASLPYRKADKYAWHFAHGKLMRDPVFIEILKRGWIAPRSQVIDIGCGQGLLPSLLIATEQCLHEWPKDWGQAPVLCSIHGLELMPQDVTRAQKALSAYADRVQFEQADMRNAPLPAADVAVLLDVLHYIDASSQAALLKKIHDALQPRGQLLIRVGDASQSLSARISQLTDKLVCRLRGMDMPNLHCRTLTEWIALLQSISFTVESYPLRQGTAFANVMLLAKKSA